MPLSLALSHEHARAAMPPVSPRSFSTRRWPDPWPRHPKLTTMLTLFLPRSPSPLATWPHPSARRAHRRPRLASSGHTATLTFLFMTLPFRASYASLPHRRPIVSASMGASLTSMQPRQALSPCRTATPGRKSSSSATPFLLYAPQGPWPHPHHARCHGGQHGGHDINMALSHQVIHLLASLTSSPSWTVTGTTHGLHHPRLGLLQPHHHRVTLLIALDYD
jgi:hypothetical protein